MNFLKHKKKYFILAILIVSIDLYTKYISNTSLLFAQPVKVTNYLNLTLLYNYGAAFSLLSNDQTSWQMILFAIISLIEASFLIYLITKQNSNNKLHLFSFALILGGAIGNFYDRAFRGYVIDFIDFHIVNYHWPVFNIADSTITCGVIILLLTSLFSKNNHKVLL